MSGAFGVMLGSGVLTVVRFIGFYLLLLWLLIAGNVALATIAMGFFAIGRSLPMLYAAGYVAFYRSEALTNHELLKTILYRAHTTLSPVRLLALFVVPALFIPGGHPNSLTCGHLKLPHLGVIV